MNSNKKIFVTNLISYLSFILYFILFKTNMFKGFFVFFAFVPYLTVLYSTFVFNVKFDYRLKAVLPLTIIDFLLRLIAMFGAFFLTSVKDRYVNYYALSAFTILFLLNLLVESFIYKKLNQNYEESQELTIDEIISKGNHKKIVETSLGFMDSIYLYLAVLLIIGYHHTLRYVLFYGIPFVLLIVAYLVSSYTNLLNYYGNKETCKKHLLYENKFIVLMIVLLILFQFFKFENMFINFIIYCSICTLSLPRYFSRRKRLQQTYEKHMKKDETEIR